MTAAPSIAAADLAAHLGGRLVGDGALTLTGVATLAHAGPHDLSWIGHPDYVRQWPDSRAGAVLTPPDCPVPEGRTAIQVPDPDLSLCAVLRLLAPPLPAVPKGVHPLADVAPDASVEGACIGPHVVVGSGASVEQGTQLHAGVYVGPDCRIGTDCVLWPNVVVRERTVIGQRVVIHPNATIGADGFGYLQRDGRHHKIPQVGRVVIEDDVEVGANACIDRARSGDTVIGQGTKIDNLVQIGHNVRVGEHCVIVAQCGLSGSVTIGERTLLSGQVGISDHARVGRDVRIAAKSVVASVTLPDGKTYRGNPAIPIADFTRQAAAARRLPKIMEQLRTLTKRVQQLESSTHHTT
jgi:UDP-3-O-[3-hydroxymyristoyl] glucosamine N-acyltransferase